MPTTAEKSSAPCFISSEGFQNEALTQFSSLCEQYPQEETSCLKLEPKHKIFLNHSGTQKPFVEQLSTDLERLNHFAFFDQRSDCLPLGEKFPALILDAAKKCQVAVVVLSREYLSSKWPMLELVEFVRAMRSENKSLRLFPVFYKASVADLSDKSIQDMWWPKWEKLVRGDARVDLKDWAAAVQELRGVNGLSFEKFENSEVKYRDAIVKGIVKLAPPVLLYDTSTIFGCDRICKILAGKFLRNSRTSPQVLGLYGMGGLGKTTMSKSLYNYFYEEFSGRVCYIEIQGGMDALERQQILMRKLLGLDNLLLQNVFDVSQGWKLLQERMKTDSEPVFLVIDNVQPDGDSKDEARKYLNLEYNSGSKILVISTSLDVIEDLLGDARYCCEIPCLTKDEAAGIFLHQGAPQINYSSLTVAEKSVVASCLKEAWFGNHDFRRGSRLYENKTGRYHPLTLRALGVYIHERNKTANVLCWNSYLHGYGTLKGTTESYKHVFKILGLQFSTLDRMTQLMFLDVVLYARKALELPMLSNSPFEDFIVWLANVHGVPTEVVRSKIFDFKRFAMININKMESMDSSERLGVIVHDLYKEYATWFLGQLNCEEVLGVWCVRKLSDPDISLPLELQRTPPGRCWPELKRIRLECIGCDGFPVAKVQEWCNVVVLQIVECINLTTINLQGLTCLRYLELKNLDSLKTLTFTGDGSRPVSSESQGTHTESGQYLPPPLQFVDIHRLDSLECLPSFSQLISLKFLKVSGCYRLTHPPSVEHCSGLERMWLEW